MHLVDALEARNFKRKRLLVSSNKTHSLRLGLVPCVVSDWQETDHCQRHFEWHQDPNTGRKAKGRYSDLSANVNFYKVGHELCVCCRQASSSLAYSRRASWLITPSRVCSILTSYSSITRRTRGLCRFNSKPLIWVCWWHKSLLVAHVFALVVPTYVYARGIQMQIMGI